MKKIFFTVIFLLFISLNNTYARDIIPISHNEFGETEIAIDLDSIKKCSKDTFCVETLSLSGLSEETYKISKDSIQITLYEFDITNKKFRAVECYTRKKSDWKIISSLSNSMLKENGLSKWETVKEDTGIEKIYLYTYLVGIKGKDYLKENIFK